MYAAAESLQFPKLLDSKTNLKSGDFVLRNSSIEFFFFVINQRLQ